jgi:hypothetical protein
MKKIFLLAVCAVLAMVSQAQTNATELKYLQDVIGMKKKQYVEEHMKISEADAVKFWTMYDEYELFRSEIGEKRVENINEYAKNYGSLTNEKADELMKKSFVISNDLDKLLQKTYTKMAKELSPVIAVQFIEIELYVEALVRKAVTEQIPALSGTDKKKN